MPPKRRKTTDQQSTTGTVEEIDSSVVHQSALSKTNRIWQRRRCTEINNALSAAERKSTDAGLWLVADGLLADVGNDLPACLLPSELADRIVRLNINWFPSVLWQIIAGYLPAGPATIEAASVAKIVCARAVCLAALDRPNDAARLVETLPMPTGIGCYFYMIRLAETFFFVSRQYELATKLFERLLAADPELYQECRIYRSLAAIFGGNVDDAVRKAIETYELTYYDVDLVNWTSFGFDCLRTPFLRRRFADLRRSLSVFNITGQRRFLQYLLDSMLAVDESDWPSTFDGAWLRRHHRGVIDNAIDWRTELRLRCPDFFVSDFDFYYS